MHKGLLGKILASVGLAAIEAGHIATDVTTGAPDPQELNDLLDGFLSIWKPQPKPIQVTPKAS